MCVCVYIYIYIHIYITTHINPHRDPHRDRLINCYCIYYCCRWFLSSVLVLSCGVPFRTRIVYIRECVYVSIHPHRDRLLYHFVNDPYDRRIDRCCMCFFCFSVFVSIDVTIDVRICAGRICICTCSIYIYI